MIKLQRKTWIFIGIGLTVVVAIIVKLIASNASKQSDEALREAIHEHPELLYQSEEDVMDMLDNLAMQLNTDLPREDQGIIILDCKLNLDDKSLQTTYQVDDATKADFEEVQEDLRSDIIANGKEYFDPMKPLLQKMNEYGYGMSSVYLNGQGDTLLYIRVGAEEL